MKLLQNELPKYLESKTEDEVSVEKKWACMVLSRSLSSFKTTQYFLNDLDDGAENTSTKFTC